jgi:transcription antitermination factor NusA-like protein
MLCSKCQEKIKAGTVSEKYIDVAKILLQQEDQFSFLQNVYLDNVLEIDGYLILIVKKGDLRKFESNPKAKKILGDIVKKRVLVIETGVRDRKFLEDLLFTQHIITINIIWLPDGSTETRVVLRSRGSKRLNKKRMEALIKIAKKVKGMDLRIDYTS